MTLQSPSKNGTGASVPPMPAEWDDSYSCFLVLCAADLDDEPDERLRLYTNAVRRAQEDAHAFRRRTLQDAATHVDPTTATGSDASSATNLSTWVDVLLSGVQDPWSRVRSVATDGLYASVTALIADETHDGDASHDADGKRHAHSGGEEDGQDESESFVVVSASSTPHRRSSVASASRGRHRTGSLRGAPSANMTSLSGVSSAGQSPHPAKRLSFLAAASTPGSVHGDGSGGGSHTPALAAVVTPTKQQMQAQKAQRRFLLDIFSKLFVKWGRAQHWYEREGMLRVWQQLLPVVMAVAEDTVAKMLVQKVCLPALRDPQVPVRDAASTLLASVAGASPLLAAVAMDRVRQSLEALAKDAEEGPASASNGESTTPTTTTTSKASEAAAYAAEGYLKSLLKLCDQHDLQLAAHDELGQSTRPAPALESFAPLLMQFASHPASSVRQCVAAALGTHSAALFALLIRSLASTATTTTTTSFDAASSASASVSVSSSVASPTAGLPRTWEFQETVLMALAEHLRFYLSQDSHYRLDLTRLFAMPGDGVEVVAFCAGEPVSSAMAATLSELVPGREDGDDDGAVNLDDLVTAVACARKLVMMQKCLCVLCDAAQSPRFESSRMSLQVLPLFLQLWVRFSTHVADLLRILHDSVPATVFVHAVVEAVEASSSSSSSSVLSPEMVVAALAAHPSFYFYAKAVLAPLWWFLAIRLYTCGSRGASLAPLVEQYGTPYYWLQHIAKQCAGGAASMSTLFALPPSPHAPGSTPTASLRLLTPLLPHLCSVHLVIATYFSKLFHRHHDETSGECECVMAQLNHHLLVLEPELWEALLASNPPSAAAALRTAVPTRQYLHVGLDFVAAVCWQHRLASSPSASVSLSTVVQRVQRLVQVWVGALASLQTHQQCTLLSMTRTALGVDVLPERLLPGFSAGIISPHARSGSVGGGASVRRSTQGMSLMSLSTGDYGALTTGPVPHLFRFVYRSLFRAPAMLDGGEDVPRGYVWLRACFPSELDAPTVTTLAENNSHDKDKGEDARSPVREAELSFPSLPSTTLPLDPRVEDAVDACVLRQLYVDPGVEPSVLREARLLMAGLCLLSTSAASHTDGDKTTAPATAPATAVTHGDWWGETLRAVFGRLDRIGPSWMASSGAGAAAATAAHATDSDHEAAAADDWDDWDDDSDDDEAVQGISVPQEVREAKSLLSQLLPAVTSGGEVEAAGEAAVFSDKLHALLNATC